DEVLRKLQFVDFEELREAFEAYQKTKTLTQIGNVLDQLVWERLLRFASLIPEEGALIKEFLLMGIEVENVKSILRLKREDVSPETIREVVAFHRYTHKLTREQLESMIEARTLKDVFTLLAQTYYGKTFEQQLSGMAEQKSLIGLELALDSYMLHKAIRFIHRHPMSVDVILGFLFAKEIEVKNLLAIIKGKQLRVDEAFIEKALVV
ncbi:hypothetical protein COY95_02235, partial [Candidatus Woesearchaeota archaeon CG_4_10_14_0_8_um_filter_47_5]